MMKNSQVDKDDITDESFEPEMSFENNLFESEEFKIDLNELIRENSMLPQPQDEEQSNSNSLASTDAINSINNEAEYGLHPLICPIKKPQPQSQPISGLNSINFNTNHLSINTPRVSLKPSLDDSNMGANELFQVTNSLRRSPQKKQIEFFSFNCDEDDYGDFLSGKRLNNDKINKLVNDLGLKNSSGESFDFALDDQLRTRFFKGRFNKSQFNIDSKDDLDLQLNTYLNSSSKKQNDNKENIAPHSDPLKAVKNKEHNSIKKSNKIFFKTPRKDNRSSIPVLKPLSNLTNVELKRVADITVKKDLDINIASSSPKRICSPKHRWNILPSKPSIKYTNPKLNIYIVDSSTGLINDATQFGTELNASNCEGFPLPEDVNEIVQIPTNDDSKSKKQKMAIIKAFRNNHFSQSKHSNEVTNNKAKIGFYSIDEFQKYKQELELQQENTAGVEVVNQSTISLPTKKRSPSPTTIVSSDNSVKYNKKRKVRWAEILEW